MVSTLILWFLFTYGVTWFLVRSSVLSGMHKTLEGTWLGRLLECDKCVSFWIGVGSTTIFPIKIPLYDWAQILGACVAGFIAMGGTALITRFGWDAMDED